MKNITRGLVQDLIEFKIGARLMRDYLGVYDSIYNVLEESLGIDDNLFKPIMNVSQVELQLY